MAINMKRPLTSAPMGSPLSPRFDANEIKATGLHLVTTDGPADQLITIWQTNMQAEGLSERTWTDWPAIVRRAAAFTNQHPAQFDYAGLNAFLASYRNANTKATYYRGLAAWSAWLVHRGHREDDPMAAIKPPKVPRGVPHPTTTAGLERLLASRLHKRTRAMILLGAYQGLRVHEIARVRAEDLDHDEQTLRVVGKGGVDALLPLHELVAAAAVGMPRRGWWFPSHVDKKRPVHSGSVSWTISKAMDRAGVRGSAHSLRHWYATALLRAGADAVTVQQLLRHASLATTQIYTQVDVTQMRAAGERLPQPRAGGDSPEPEADSAVLLREMREMRDALRGLAAGAGGDL